MPSSPMEMDVVNTLRWALERRIRVAVIIRGDVEAGRPARLVEGVPKAFRPTSDGRMRIVLEVIAGEADQLIVVERIARVTPVTA